MENNFEKWFEDITYEEYIQLQKKYGFYGHDMGCTEDEWKWIYEQENEKYSEE